MEKGRRRSRRKRVENVEVVPSTDLPPLVEGELRCFLHVSVGRLSWGNITPSRAPPVSPAYVRLRWWGEASDGTLFRPQGKKDDVTVKSRAQFGIRSGPKQMTAYFNDMGTITLDVLSSPKSMPIGRVQIPNVARLSSSTPIRGFFPIISSSSRKLGELHVVMSFKSLRNAYEEDSNDTATDSSFSSRSRNTSAYGMGSRRSSRHSSVGSARSRSSSAGSYKQTRGRSRSNSSKRGRRKSSSSHSRDRRSGSHEPTYHSRNGIQSDSINNGKVPTPRGVDEYLEQNGHDLHAMGLPMRKAEKKTTQVDGSGIDMNAIKALLQRGKKLRDEITQSALSPDASHLSHNNFPSKLPEPREIAHPSVNLQPPSSPSREVRKSPVQFPPQLPQATNIQPIEQMSPFTQQKTDTELRLVDMVLQAKGIKEDTLNMAEVSSVVSGVESLVSDIEDPLHDQSILQHLFYNNMGFYPTERPTLERTLISEPTYTETQLQQIVSQPDESERSDHKQLLTLIDKLAQVHLARITVKGIQLRESFEPEEEEKQAKKHSGKKKDLYVKVGSNKPPPSSTVIKSTGTYFIEYKFPLSQKAQGSTLQRTLTSHDVTRIASRRLNFGGLVKFDQHSVFPVSFTQKSLQKWMTESLSFVVHYKSAKARKLQPIGKATLPLRQVVESDEFMFSGDIEIICENPFSVCGCIKVSVELCGDVKDLSSQLSPTKQPASVQIPNTYSITKPAQQKTSDTTQEHNKSVGFQHFDQSRVKAVCEKLPRNNPDNEQLLCHNMKHSVLYLYVLLQEARDIPATKPSEGKCNFPSVYLICRNFASDEPSITPVVWNTSNPKFKFSLVLPVKINSNLFSRLKDNYLVVEVWTKVPSEDHFSDKLMGLVKIPLNIFYQSLRDDQIARAVLESEHPIVAVDSFQPIVDVFTGNERGKLKPLLALGTKTQIENLKKEKERTEIMQPTPKSPQKPDISRVIGNNLHEFQIKVHEMQGFKPLDSQSWGEMDCFIQYYFPTQQRENVETDAEDHSDNHNHMIGGEAALESFTTEMSLCIPNPKFNFTQNHELRPPLGVPVHRLILDACSGVGKHAHGGIPFELWSRFYYPNIGDQLLAKGFLPAAKLCSIITTKPPKKDEEVIDIPMKFIEVDGRQSTSAGDVRISVKYNPDIISKREKTKELCRNIKLEVGVLRACGLKRAAELAASLTNDQEMTHNAKVGVNAYVVVKVSFLYDEKPRKTNCVARSFSPDFNHHFDVMCPIMCYHDNVEPISLAEQLAGGEVDFEVWHKRNADDNSVEDVLLGHTNVTLSHLLTRTTGCCGWYPVTSIEQRKSIVTVGGLQLSLTFPCSQDLELILRSAKSIAWKPNLASDLTRLLVPDSNGLLRPVDEIVTKDDHVTVTVTVTNAWLSSSSLTRESDEVDKKACVYIRYKFFDKDSVTSSVSQVFGGPKIVRDPCSVKIAHRCSFVCKVGHPLVWYLREEKVEIKLWITHSRAARLTKRPLDSDKLVGTASVDLSSMLAGGIHKSQHVSGSFPLFKAGVDDLGEACLRVYVSTNPGANTDYITDEDEMLPTTATSSDEENDVEVQEQFKEPHLEAGKLFRAVVTIERAMHLPPPSPRYANNPGCFVTYGVGGGETPSAASKVTPLSTSPVWDDSQEVELDNKLLLPGGGSLIFRMWVSSGEVDEEGTKSSSDSMIGYASVDISTLCAGFNSVNGWYNIIDLHGNCQGQLKIAVTPSTPVTKPHSIPAKVESTVKGLLHSVPLITPVRTPSGSMYIPCVSSTQTVGSTCRITTATSRFPASSNTTTFAPINPQVSLFASTSILRQDQQSCLLQTLQRQMKELDEIKQNFQQKSRGFVTITPPATVSMQTSDVTTATTTVPSHTTHVAIRKPPFKDPVVPSKLDNNLLGSIGSQQIMKKPTVHMSLMRSERGVYDEEMALSDTEMSDVEFVCPRNINQKSIFTSESQEEVNVDGPVLGSTLHTTGSELNNTSLWLSASASNVDESLSYHDEDVVSTSKQVDDHHEDVASTSKQVDDLPRKLFSDEEPEDESSPVRIEDACDKEFVAEQDKTDSHSISDDNPSKEEDSDHPADEERDGDEQTVEVGVEETRNEDEEENLEASSVDKEVEHPKSDKEESSDENISSQSEDGDDHEGQDVEGSNLSSEDESSEESDEDEAVKDARKILDDVSNTSSVIHPSSQHASLPSFFPPQNDLIASMRSLQAITTEQKRKVLRQDPIESLQASESTTSPNTQHRRKFVKPSTTTNEQTNRLAKIFSTKYTTN